MDLLDLALSIHLNPKHTSSTHGGEYVSPCPFCQEGKDRFHLWPKRQNKNGTQGSYWCRKCGKSGDKIQFCRELLGYSYVDACAKVGESPQKYVARNFMKPNFRPQSSCLPGVEWQNQATAFAHECHCKLLKNQEALSMVKKRRLSEDSIKLFCLGWNDLNRFDAPNLWGFDSASRAKDIWLPRGLIIPTYEDKQVVKLKIRRVEWTPEDRLPKYVEVSGSYKAPSIYGKTLTNVVLLEAELDAMLLQQFAHDLCCCIAIGGVGKKPDIRSDQVLKSSSVLLFALDFDDAGKKAYKFWKDAYPHLKPWPIPVGKSVGDFCALGKNPRNWLKAGLQ